MASWGCNSSLSCFRLVLLQFCSFAVEIKTTPQGVLLPFTNRNNPSCLCGAVFNGLPQRICIRFAMKVRPSYFTTLETRSKYISRHTQNSLPPSETSLSVVINTQLPSPSGTPSVSTSDFTGPIWRGGKLTTARTCLPSNSSLE